MNKNYVSGRSYEYKAKRSLEEQGYTVIRAAGSHGPYDLIAFKPTELPRCIQIKKVQKEGAMKRLLFDFEQSDREAVTTYLEELWVYFNRKCFRVVYDPRLDGKKKKLDIR